MSKVFGYPKFDASGEMVLTTYDGDYSARSEEHTSELQSHAY